MWRCHAEAEWQFGVAQERLAEATEGKEVEVLFASHAVAAKLAQGFADGGCAVLILHLHVVRLGEILKPVVWIFFSVTPSFFSAANTPVMRLLLAASAAAAVGALVVTPALTVATSGAVRSSPWPLMDKVRATGSAARAGETRAAASAKPSKRRFFMIASFKIGCPSKARMDENRGEIRARLAAAKILLYPLSGWACSSVG